MARFSFAHQSCNWVDVPQAQWTMTAVSDDPASYPLGYRKGTFYEDNNPSFGVRVQNTKGRKVQVFVETMQNAAQVCVRDLSLPFNMANTRTINQCNSQHLVACFDAPTDLEYTDFVIYCNQGCRSAHTDFWYRVEVSSTTWTDGGGLASNPTGAIAFVYTKSAYAQIRPNHTHSLA